MLTIENIRQILSEHEVLDLQPEAAEENLDFALFAMAEERAVRRGEPLRLDDGVFVSWAICLPFFRQPRSYSEFMRARRSEWFEGVTRSAAETRARAFFTPQLLRFELDELAALVTAWDAVRRINPYLGEFPPETTPQAASASI